jgi:hypothetical protein
MQQILNNPYRILGILAGASTREQNRQANNLKQYIAAGQDPPVDYSFPALGGLPNAIEAIDEANSKLNLDSDKMNAALFWFWKGNEITDEPAFDALKDGYVTTAWQIWDKMVTTISLENKRFWKDVTKKNASAFHNRAILVLWHNTLGSYVDAVMANIKFIESDYFSDFAKSIVDITHRFSKKEIELKFLDVIINEITGGRTGTSLSQLVKYLNDYDFSAKQDFLKNVAKILTDKIAAQIETTRRQRTANKANAATAGKNLYKNTKDDLSKLKEIFGAQDFNYSNTADKVANEILQCGIDYFNYYKDSNTDPSIATMDLFEKAQSLAIGNICKQRCDENIAGLQEWIDDKPNREKETKIKPHLESLRESLQLFETRAATIANAESLINQVKPDLDSIKIIIGSTDSLYLKLSTRVAAQAQHYIIEEVNSAQENIEVKMIINRYETINNLKTILANAWDATLLIETLDMEHDFKINRYNPNKVTLQGLCGQMGVSTRTGINRPISTVPSRPYSPVSKQKSWAEENPGCVVALVIGAIILLIVIISNS